MCLHCNKRREVPVALSAEMSVINTVGLIKSVGLIVTNFLLNLNQFIVELKETKVRITKLYQLNLHYEYSNA